MYLQQIFIFFTFLRLKLIMQPKNLITLGLHHRQIEVLC